MSDDELATQITIAVIEKIFGGVANPDEQLQHYKKVVEEIYSTAMKAIKENR